MKRRRFIEPRFLSSWTILTLMICGVCLGPIPSTQAKNADSDSPPDAPATSGTNKGKSAAKSSERKPDSSSKKSSESTKPSVVGWVQISRTLRDGPVPFSWVSREDAGLSLQDVLDQIKTVANGEQYKGLVIHLDSPQLTMTQTGQIARAIRDARSHGKKVLVFAEAYDLRGYLIGCAADMILLQHKGSVEVNGLQVEEWYLGGLLKKLGVKADLVQIGKYKGAADPMTRTQPTKAWDQNMSRLMDDLYAQVIADIKKGRHMNKDQVERLLANAWSMSDQQLLDHHVVDRLTNRDLINVTEIEFGDQFTWDQAMGVSTAAAGSDPGNPLAMFRMLFEKKQVRTTGPTIAVIHAAGPIHSGKSGSGGAFSSESIGSKTLVKLLGKVGNNDHIKGLVLRVDSPGGSALASEVMWQAIRQVGQSKPVFASVGSIAASGGYYLVCATDEIYVAPRSIVGSIGVVGGKVVLGGLYDMAGIHVRRRSRGPNADMFNSVQAFTKNQRKQLRKALTLVYDQFTNRVKIGRGNRIEDLSKLAKGRLFTGHTAVGNGLADQIGGVDQAVKDMAKQLDLDHGAYDVLDLPRPISFQQFLSDAFSVASPVSGASSRSPIKALTQRLGKSTALTAARDLLGPRAWAQVRQTLSGLLLLRNESTLTLLPHAVLIK